MVIDEKSLNYETGIQLGHGTISTADRNDRFPARSGPKLTGLSLHNLEALGTKNLKRAIFVGVFVDHYRAVSRLFPARMRGDTRPLEAANTIDHVTSGHMAFTMENPNFFHAASLPLIAMSGDLHAK